MICKYCGATLNDNEMFCTQCGKSIDRNNTPMGGVTNNPNVNTYNPINEPQYTPSYTPTNEPQYAPSYSEPQNNGGYNPYNNYNNPQRSGNNVGIIILVAILSAIIFFIIGLLVGRAMPKNDSKVSEQKQPESSQIEDKKAQSNSTGLFQSLTKGNNTSATTNYIETTNNGKVTFHVPNTFVEDDEAFSDSEVRHFILNNDDSDLGVYIAEEYGTLSDYLDEVDEKATRYKSYGYRNVTVSDVSFTVNKKNFSGKVLSYDMEYSKFVDAFIAYELSPRTIYAVEIEEYNEISENELNDFLTITISE